MSESALVEPDEEKADSAVERLEDALDNDRLNISAEMREYAEEAARELDEADYSRLKKTSALAGAAVYYAAHMVGEKFTQAEVAEAFETNTVTVQTHYEALLDMNGLTRAEMRERLTRESIKRDLHAIDEDDGRPPSRSRYIDVGKHYVGTVEKYFGDDSDLDGWPGVIEDVGLDPEKIGEGGDDPEQRTPDDVLIDDFERVTNILGRPPRYIDYKRLGNHGTETMHTHLGSTEPRDWDLVVEACGYKPEDTDPEETPLERVQRAKEAADRYGFKSNIRLALALDRLLGAIEAGELDRPVMDAHPEFIIDATRQLDEDEAAVGPSPSGIVAAVARIVLRDDLGPKAPTQKSIAKVMGVSDMTINKNKKAIRDRIEL